VSNLSNSILSYKGYYLILSLFKATLYIFYPGEYVLGAILFLLTLLVLKRDLNKLEKAKQLITNDEDLHGHDNPAYEKK
jgi:hypothetical protein